MKISTEAFRKDGKFLMLALDHRGSFKSGMNPGDPDAVSKESIVDLKMRIIEPLASLMSGVLIDGDYGLPALKSIPQINTPFLLPAEKTGYESTGASRKTLIELGASEIKEKGASGVKLLLYFHPDADSADYQLSIAKQVLEDSHKNNLPLFLELVSYEVPGKSRSSIVFDSVSRFLSEGISPDVFKLEYPGNINECSRITSLLGEVPWILLTRGVSFDVFLGQLKEARSSGARGFLAGRALWQEALSMKDDLREDFLKRVLPDRFRTIAEVFNN